MGIEGAFRRIGCFSRSIALLVMWGLLILFPLAAEQWYLSDGAGIPLREVPPLVAQRQEYALRVDWTSPTVIAKDLRERYFPHMAKVERAELFHQGQVILVRYRIYDALLVLLGRIQEDHYNRRVVEVLDTQGRRRIEEWSEKKVPKEKVGDQKQDEIPYEGMVVYYTYDGPLLTEGDVQDLKGKALWKDRYRYDRSGVLRSVYREYAEPGEKERFSFSAMVKNIPSDSVVKG
ncbi:MAG: hypothetical protein N2509_09230, partial [Treponemataceae bacterium]|nr:hypothetical protein [Treponemataceae bacterium]